MRPACRVDSSLASLPTQRGVPSAAHRNQPEPQDKERADEARRSNGRRANPHAAHRDDGLCDADIIAAIGVNQSTFYRWLKDGENAKSGVKRALFTELKRPNPSTSEGC